ncbi:hypothetical protein GIB67_013064 [Kingdonia uniflora]|uniref:Uncharacterized protein n=1 Tax=Kingdonia uniflora TaxID=39325 RepID=A0A7J7MCN3_9MAGN|nr:hypothetical protein GIB67_013064 [Kingdonia uniflora]
MSNTEKRLMNSTRQQAETYNNDDEQLRGPDEMLIDDTTLSTKEQQDTLPAQQSVWNKQKGNAFPGPSN